MGDPILACFARENHDPSLDFKTTPCLGNIIPVDFCLGHYSHDHSK